MMDQNLQIWKNGYIHFLMAERNQRSNLKETNYLLSHFHVFRLVEWNHCHFSFKYPLGLPLTRWLRIAGSGKEAVLSGFRRNVCVSVNPKVLLAPTMHPCSLRLMVQGERKRGQWRWIMKLEHEEKGDAAMGKKRQRTKERALPTFWSNTLIRNKVAQGMIFSIL